jgi:hypothetical protein
MKRWAILTVLLYALLLVLLTAPLLFLALGDWWGHGDYQPQINFAETLKVYKSWEYWLVLAVFLLGQALLLLVPVDVSQRRLTPRRKLLAPIIVSAFLFANVIFGALFSVACAIWGDGPFGLADKYGGDAVWLSILLLIIVFLWVIWGVVFYRATKSCEPQDAVARLVRWLLRGSILELLVVVPSHIIVRNRNVCCAPLGSFWGIATGLAVMLLCYGPGVFFLFVARIHKRLRPKSQ